jgi:hypothetical protein
MNKYKKIVSLSIILLIIVGFIGYKVYEKFQIIECSTVKNCKTCAKSFGCLWCKTSKKCISDLSKNLLCFRESTVADPFGCDIDSVEDISGSNLNSPLFGGSCSANKDCSTCLRSPDCFWCNNSQQCAGSVELYAKCKDDINIFNSSNQCSTAKNNLPESTVEFNPNDSILPKQGLLRNTDGSLTNSSLKIIFDSIAAKGTPIEDPASKERVLSTINQEINFHKNKFKSSISSYIGNTIDYVNDPKSLEEAKNTEKTLQDLRDISRYINEYSISFLQDSRPKFSSKDTMDQLEEGIEMFTTYGNQNVEKFVNTYIEKDDNDYIKEKNKIVARNLELFWLGSIVALGTLYYFMKI